MRELRQIELTRHRIVIGVNALHFRRCKQGFPTSRTRQALFLVLEVFAGRGRPQELYRELSRVFGFLDGEYRLSRLIQRLDPGWRSGARGPYDDVWKLSTNKDDRQTALWSRIETDPKLNAHARAVWGQQRNLPPVSEEIIAMTQKATREAVAAIRARGGEV